MNKLKSKHSLEDHDFGELAKTESKARARTRLYILHQYRIGKQSFEIAENLSINIETVRRTRSDPCCQQRRKTLGRLYQAA